MYQPKLIGALPRISIEMERPRVHDARRLCAVMLTCRAPSGERIMIHDYVPERDATADALAASVAGCVARLLSNMELLTGFRCECGLDHVRHEDGSISTPGGAPRANGLFCITREGEVIHHDSEYANIAEPK